jgi:hypothetical protein
VPRPFALRLTDGPAGLEARETAGLETRATLLSSRLFLPLLPRRSLGLDPTGKQPKQIRETIQINDDFGIFQLSGLMQ